MGGLQWEVRNYEALYISNILKCDASFLVWSSSSGVPAYKKIWLEDAFLHYFTPYAENNHTYVCHNVSVRIPRNRAALDVLPDDSYLGAMTGYFGFSNRAPMSRNLVEHFAEVADYPLV